jgi:hypothetical protein
MKNTSTYNILISTPEQKRPYERLRRIWEEDNDVHVDGVRLRLWTAVTNWPTVHPPGDVWTRITMVEWCKKRRTPDSSTRATCKSYQHSHLVASRRNGRREWWICPCEELLFIRASCFFMCRKNLRLEASGFTVPSKENVSRIFIALKIYRLGGVWTHEPWV